VLTDFCSCYKLLDFCPQAVAVHRDILPDADFRVPGFLHIFAFYRKLFEELFAGT
jgi:hypothetical protein